MKPFQALKFMRFFGNVSKCFLSSGNILLEANALIHRKWTHNRKNTMFQYIRKDPGNRTAFSRFIYSFVTKVISDWVWGKVKLPDSWYTLRSKWSVHSSKLVTRVEKGLVLFLMLILLSQIYDSIINYSFLNNNENSH